MLAAVHRGARALDRFGGRGVTLAGMSRCFLRLRTLALVGLLPTPGLGQAVSQVEVLPPQVTLSVGQRQGVLATAYDARGQVMATVRITWSSTNLAVARVEQDPTEPGVATIVGVAPGVASVEAQAGGRRGTVQVQVTGGAGGAPPPVTLPVQPAASDAAAIRIDPNSVMVLPSEEARLTISFIKADGSPAAPMPFTWSSLNAAVATVASDGSVVGISSGQSVIEARTATGLVARTSVLVAQAPIAFAAEVMSLSPLESDTVRILVPSQGNRRVASRWFTWTTSNPNVVVVNPLGVATAVGSGQAEVFATGFSQTGRLAVVVHKQVEQVRLLPPSNAGPVTVPMAGSVQFTAEALAADETPIPEAPFNWTVADTSIAAFDPVTKTLRGKRMGRTRLQMRGPGRGLDASWTVDVVAGGLGVAPGRLGLGVSDRKSLTASFVNDRGVVLAPATSVSWVSLRPSVATVDNQGNVQGVEYGHAQVVASVPWGKADTVDVYVQAEILVTSTRSGSADLWAFERGSPARFNRITRDSLHSEGEGAFSPDGSQIAYVTDRDGNVEIYVMSADGSNPRRLTTTDATEGSPSWTPDGRQLVYASNVSGNFQVWIMNADGSGPRQLTQEPASNFQPVVSPDGKAIAFTSDRDRSQGSYDIFVMALDGSGQRGVTRAQVAETTPIWFPDGQLGYVVQEAARRGSVSSRVMRMNLTTGETVAVSPQGLAVADVDVSRNGELLALVVTTFERGGSVVQRLYLVAPGTPSVAPAEVPRVGNTDRLSSPSFRR